MNTDTTAHGQRVDNGVWVNRGLIGVCAIFLMIMAIRFVLGLVAPTVPTAAPTLAPAILAPSQAQSAIVTSVSAPVGFKVVVPGSLKEPVKLMKGSNSMRVYLEFEQKDTDAVKALFVKGGSYYITARK